MFVMQGHEIKNFGLYEFPEDPRDCAELDLVLAIDKFRDILNKPIYPSPVAGALARNDIGSMHHYSSEDNIKSKAVDCFCQDSPYVVFSLALCSQLFGGIGVYFDGLWHGKNCVRYHFDIRKLGEKHAKPTVLVWCYTGSGGTIYPEYDNCWDLFYDKLLSMNI